MTTEIKTVFFIFDTLLGKTDIFVMRATGNQVQRRQDSQWWIASIKEIDLDKGCLVTYGTNFASDDKWFPFNSRYTDTDQFVCCA